MTETVAVKEERQSCRLPRTVVPTRYDISLTPDLKAATFTGRETIDVEVTEAVREIVLNALELEIQSARLVPAKADKPVSAQIGLDLSNERVTLKFAKETAPGKYKLELEFKGILNDKLHGFYRSSYKDKSKKEHILAVTQFEPTDARRAFPCFDEPDFKATFKITLIVDKGLTAISNSPIEATETSKTKGKVEVSFKETMKMSTYLVAFVVGEFDESEPSFVDKVPIRIFTPKGKGHLGKFAQESAVHSLKFFNNYYGIKYPGEKLDLIAVPDFMFGAMENLGAVIFRENALLVDEKVATHAELERIADVVAHELAHMWFGDLATMRWWNGLWLNEAFATFMSMLAVDDWKPEWRRWDMFGASRAQAFATDGLLSTRPIEFPVNRPEDAEGMFDVLTYEKGASVLRMLEQYLGPDQFRKGIAHYLKKHQYSNTETTDLWDALEETTKQPVRQMMDSWIFQEGHPIVTVKREDDGRIWSLSQKRFCYLPEEKRAHFRSHGPTNYQTPVLYRYKAESGKEQDGSILLNAQKRLIELDTHADWLLANGGGHGFYRCEYSQSDLKTITPSLFKKLSPIERFNLISDLWALTLNGSVRFNDFARTLILYKEETDRNVWTAMQSILLYLDRVIGQGNRRPYREFASELLKPAYIRLGLNKSKKEDHLTSSLRGLVVQAVGIYAEDQSLRSKAVDLFDTYLEEPSKISPDVVPAIIQIVASAGDAQRYKQFVEHFRSAKTPQEEERFMYGLSWFRDEALLKKTLEKTLNGEIRTQNAPYIVRSVMWNPYGRELAWSFMRENLDKMLKQFPDGMIARMCEGITGLVSNEMLSDAQEFFGKHEIAQGRKLIAQHLEKLAVAVHFHEREINQLERPWLKLGS